MEYQRLSYSLYENIPVYYGSPRPVIKNEGQISRGDDYNSYIIIVENHSGTHVDAPKHFIEEGRNIADYNLDELFFSNPLIIDCPKEYEELIEIKDFSKNKLEDVDCLLFRTGFGRYRIEKADIYRNYYPGISSEAICWLRKKFQSIRCLGIDTLSITSSKQRKIEKKVHIAAFINKKGLGEPLLIIEDMNLNNLSRHDELENLMIIPWQVSGIDSAPCTVLAKIK
jgi:arylformamidase